MITQVRFSSNATHIDDGGNIIADFGNIKD